MSSPLTPFTIIPPSAPETPLIVEVPHAGLHIDPESLAVCAAPARSIGQDADLYVSELFAGAPSFGATYLYSNMSRYVCDLNREENDYDAHTSLGGVSASSPHGVVWRKTTEGRPALLAPLSQGEIDRRLDLIYRPYHKALGRLIQEKRARFGFAVLLCGHSMPSFGRLGERRADVVPGSRGKTSAAPLVLRAAELSAEDSDYSLSHDNPYRGGFTTAHYGSPGAGIHALQIELSRRLYMDESLLARNANFPLCVEFCNRLMKRLAELRL